MTDAIIPVGHKPIVARSAIATGVLDLSPDSADAIRNGLVAKGDVLEASMVAAIQAVKETPRAIPHCHIIPIEACSVVWDWEDNSLRCTVSVSAHWKTGVEMEAIMGVNAALITIYDLSKIVNPHLKIDNVKLLIKEGGKSGLWTNPDGLPKFLENIF